MEFKNDLSLATIVAVSATAIGTSFQIGYFWAIGIRFISYVSLADWLFASAFLYVVTIGLAQIVFILWRLLEDLVENATAKRVARLGTTITIGLCGLSYITTWLFWPQYAAFVGFLISIAMFITVVVSGIFILVPRLKEYPTTGKWPYRNAIIFLLLLNMPVVLFGGSVARMNLGNCLLTYHDGKSEVAEYLRFLGEGHLIRSNGQVRVIAKDRLQETACFH